MCPNLKSVSVSRSRDRMVVGFTTTYAISFYHHQHVVSSNPNQAIQRYVIKFVRDWRQVGGFLRLVRVPPLIKLTATI